MLLVVVDDDVGAGCCCGGGDACEGGRCCFRSERAVAFIWKRLASAPYART